MHEITFYSWALSPYANKVQCYLLYIDVEFETVFVDPMDVREILPVGTTIPVLTFDGESRNESTALGLWLNELYPDKQLVPKSLHNKIIEADAWISTRLINHLFRESLGFDDSIVRKVRKRWFYSKVLNQTSPKGVGVLFRILHAMFVGQTFVKQLVASTDRNKPLPLLREELANEFKNLLEQGPFLCGSTQPTLADLSAYPLIVNQKVLHGLDYFLPGKIVEDWVLAMERTVPNLTRCFPEKIKHECTSSKIVGPFAA